MRWKRLRKSDQVRDNRKAVPGGAIVGGGIGVIVIVLLATFLGADPSEVIKQMPSGQGNQGAPPAPNPEQDEMVEFVSKVLGSTEDVWTKLFRGMGKEYRKPELEVFTGQTKSACGFATAAVGPFYCSADEDIYIDLAFYDQMKRQLGAAGDFAQAYVIAHEVGHHVQRLLGILGRVNEERQRVDQREANKLSVRLELQADFLAGVWAKHAQRMWRVLEPGDLEEALNAASAIGDDKLQKQQQGYVVPDSFTHGTSAQRVAWFRYGYETGDPTKGNAFDDDVFRRVSPR